MGSWVREWKRRVSRQVLISPVIMLNFDPECIKLLLFLQNYIISAIWHSDIAKNEKILRMQNSRSVLIISVSALYIIYFFFMKIKKKQLKFTILPSKPQPSSSSATSPSIPSIKITVDDQYFLRCVNTKLFKFPPNVTENYKIDYHGRQILLTPNNNSNNNSTGSGSGGVEGIVKGLKECFSNFWVFHVREHQLLEIQQQLRHKLRLIKNHSVYGFKRFVIDQGRFQRDDILFYARQESLTKTLFQVQNFIQNQSLLFNTTATLSDKHIPSKYRPIVNRILVQENQQYIRKVGEELGLEVGEVRARETNGKGKEDKEGEYWISIVVTGNRYNVHDVYEKMDGKIYALPLTIVETEEQLQGFEQNAQNFARIFGEYENKIFKVSPTAVLIINRIMTLQQIQEVKRKLKLKVWIVDENQLTLEEINILKQEYKSHSLKPHMINKKIFWQEISFPENEIKIVCDRITKNKFVIECQNLLKSFIKVQQNCEDFDTRFLVQIFTKYYQKALENKLCVQFEIGDCYVIRHNFNKYSEDIMEELKNVRDKIRKKIVNFVSQRSIRSIKNVNFDMFSEIVNPEGYQHQLLGCSLYEMGNVRIKMKRIENLKKQQEFITYLLDDRLDNDSIFYKIIKKNQINYQSFLVDVRKTKKPDRIRQYQTPDCPYGFRTVLLHGGPQKVTQTLKRDLESLLSMLGGRLCAILFRHCGDFLRDVFWVVLEYIAAHGKLLESDVNVDGSSFLPRFRFQADFYYEGGPDALEEIEKLMKYSNLGIRRLSSFCLQQTDLQKIYALQYCTLTLSPPSPKPPITASPLIAQLLHYHLHRLQKQTRRKFIFSMPQKISHQLIEFLISNRTDISFKITHDEDKKNWSHRPRIEPLEELEPQLQSIVDTIRKYLALEYVIVSAESISDGVHGRKIRYCRDFYLAVEGKDWLQRIDVNIEKNAIYQIVDRGNGDGDGDKNGNQEIGFKYGVRELKEWYEITAYKEELDDISTYAEL